MCLPITCWRIPTGTLPVGSFCLGSCSVWLVVAFLRFLRVPHRCVASYTPLPLHAATPFTVLPWRLTAATYAFTFLSPPYLRLIPPSFCSLTFQRVPWFFPLRFPTCGFPASVPYCPIYPHMPPPPTSPTPFTPSPYIQPSYYIATTTFGYSVPIRSSVPTVGTSFVACTYSSTPILPCSMTATLPPPVWVGCPYLLFSPTPLFYLHCSHI